MTSSFRILHGGMQRRIAVMILRVYVSAICQQPPRDLISAIESGVDEQCPSVSVRIRKVGDLGFDAGDEFPLGDLRTHHAQGNIFNYLSPRCFMQASIHKRDAARKGRAPKFLNAVRRAGDDLILIHPVQLHEVARSNPKRAR